MEKKQYTKNTTKQRSYQSFKCSQRGKKKTLSLGEEQKSLWEYCSLGKTAAVKAACEKRLLEYKMVMIVTTILALFSKYWMPGFKIGMFYL